MKRSECLKYQVQLGPPPKRDVDALKWDFSPA